MNITKNTALYKYLLKKDIEALIYEKLIEPKFDVRILPDYIEIKIDTINNYVFDLIYQCQIGDFDYKDIDAKKIVSKLCYILIDKFSEKIIYGGIIQNG